jgi:hypothetical protein
MSGTGSDGGTGGAAGRLVFSRTPAGDPVAECELAAGDTGLLSELARQAACHGAVLLWVHCAADLSKAGFAARQGYRRFTAAAVPPGDPLPLLDTPAVLGLLPRAFTGQWGHHQFDAAWARAAEARYVGRGQRGHWIGLCRFEPPRRHIDGPGFPAGPGSPDAVRLLVAGARRAPGRRTGNGRDLGRTSRRVPGSGL